MILVTGASGFIGRHLLASLIEKYGEDKVIALTSRPVSGCQFLLHHNYQFDSDYFINSGFRSIETVIHAGAFTPKNAKQADEWKKSSSNIRSTHALLRSSLPQLVRFIFISTLDVYGKDDLITEASPIEPVSLYGYSKLYCEKIVDAWSKENSKVAQILRVGHVYGPGEEAYQKIIPATFQRLVNNENVQLWGTGRELRTFIYVNDVVRAIVNSIELPGPIGPVNIVGNNKISIKDLIDKLVSISGVPAEIERMPVVDTGRDLVFDNSKMRNFLLANETPLEDGLMAEWRHIKQLRE